MATLDEIFEKLKQIQDELAVAVASAKLNPKQIAIVNGLSDINNSLGSVRAGEFLALSSGQDPQDDDGTGTFISAAGRLFGADRYHIGGVKDGDLKWGANSETGDFEAGDGVVNLNDDGFSILEGSNTPPTYDEPGVLTYRINFLDEDGAPKGYITQSLDKNNYSRSMTLAVEPENDALLRGRVGMEVKNSSGTSVVGMGVNGAFLEAGAWPVFSLGEEYVLLGGLAQILDDEAYSFSPSRADGAILFYDVATAAYCGILIYSNLDALATAGAYLLSAGASTNVTTGALTGTTGTDAKLTISAHIDGKIYIENRTGKTIDIRWNIFGGGRELA